MLFIMPSWMQVNPPYKFKWTEKTVPVTEGSSETTTEGSQQAAARNKGKAIVNSPPPTYDQEPDMVAEDDEMSKEKEIDKLMALISLSFKKVYKPTNNNLITSSNTNRANQDNTSRINTGTGYDNQRVVKVAEARENIAYNKEKMLFYKQEEAGIQLSDEQADWRDGIDDEPGDQELEHPRKPESVNITYLKEHGDTNITTDSLDMSNNKGEADQDEDEDLARERDLLASLIDKLKCEIDDSK
ncbi:hypothetical protein Tco_0789636, partial [Tanacetum coccineum]